MCATEQHSVETKTAITQKAIRVPSKLEALREKLQKAMIQACIIGSLLLSAQDNDKLRQKLTSVETEMEGSRESTNSGLCRTGKTGCFYPPDSKNKYHITVKGVEQQNPLKIPS